MHCGCQEEVISTSPSPFITHDPFYSLSPPPIPLYTDQLPSANLFFHKLSVLLSKKYPSSLSTLLPSLVTEDSRPKKKKFVSWDHQRVHNSDFFSLVWNEDKLDCNKWGDPQKKPQNLFMHKKEISFKESIMKRGRLGNLMCQLVYI